jgi:hypothetical protein
MKEFQSDKEYDDYIKESYNNNRMYLQEKHMKARIERDLIRRELNKKSDRIIDKSIKEFENYWDANKCEVKQIKINGDVDCVIMFHFLGKKGFINNLLNHLKYCVNFILRKENKLEYLWHVRCAEFEIDERGYTKRDAIGKITDSINNRLYLMQHYPESYGGNGGIDKEDE